jgi:hypothetical protein
MATQLTLKCHNESLDLGHLEQAGCTVTRDGKEVSISIPGELLHIVDFASQINTQEMCYIYTSVYSLKGNDRLIYREKVRGPLGKMKSSVELFVFLNSEED